MIAIAVLAVVPGAAGQEQKPPIAFAETSTVTLICGDAESGKHELEVRNETATEQTVGLQLSQLRDEDGTFHEATEVCGGVAITQPARLGQS